MPPTLYLIDGHALAYRTYFALTRGSESNRWRTRSGEPTAGVFGFTSVLLRIFEQENPDYLAVAFDTGKTFRDEMFADYKATRAKMPDDLVPQIERIRQLVDAFNIPRLEMEGYEADDVLGSVATQAVEQGLGVKIITGDRDLLQLVRERLVVNLPSGSLSDAKDYFPEDVKDYLGVDPDQVVDFKALVGDTSDNIPGVAGIGQKTAINLLNEYGTLDAIYAHLDDLPAGIRKKLDAGRDNAHLSRDLARIVTDLTIQVDLDMARPEHFNPSQVEELFRELEFRSLMKRLEGLYQKYGHMLPAQATGQQLSMFAVEKTHAENRSAVVDSPTQFEVVDTPEKLARLVEKLQAAEMIAFDTETTSTDQMQAILVGISLAVEEGSGYYIPVGHATDDYPQLPLQQVLEALRDPLTNPGIPKAGHNLKYDFILLARHGLRVAPLAFDTMIAEWLVNPNSRNLGLKNLAWVRLNMRMTEIEELIGKGKKQVTMAEAPVDLSAAYAAADADAVLRLVPILQRDLEMASAQNLFVHLEMPLVTVLADMEMAGVSLDRHFLSVMAQEVDARLIELSTRVFGMAGYEFNLNSTQQLSQVLFDRLGLVPPDRARKTSSGFFSTSAEVLESMKGQHEVVDLILDYRELAKLKSTYIDALPLQVNPQTGRIHTSYNQTGSVTGRIASSEPNLQNIPIRTETGRQVRKAFVAKAGYKLLAVDYSQVELRIAAHMSEDQGMLAAFKADQDIHRATAAAIYGVPIEAVSGEQRRHAKAINFGLLYGMSAFGLTRTTDLTLGEAENFITAYFQQFPGIRGYLERVKRQATQQGFVETLMSRRRYFPGLREAGNAQVRNREEREAINAPIQGTAADIIKMAMLRLPAALHEAGLDVQMLLQVHDELVFECNDKQLQETGALVQQVMEQAFDLAVPLKTEARVGLNWGDMYPIIM